MMARKAIPIDLLVVSGNKHLSKEEIEARREAEAQLNTGDDKLKPPAWLSKDGKREFKRLVEELKKTRLITNLDVHALALYCDAYAQYIECTKRIQEEGLMVMASKGAETTEVPHPLLVKKRQLFDQMRSLVSEFGLTPAARAKLALPKKEKKEEPTKFEKMFGNV